MDLPKASDPTDYKLLLNKLNIDGIRGTALKLADSYFQNR